MDFGTRHIVDPLEIYILEDEELKGVPPQAFCVEVEGALAAELTDSQFNYLACWRDVAIRIRKLLCVLGVWKFW